MKIILYVQFIFRFIPNYWWVGTSTCGDEKLEDFNLNSDLTKKNTNLNLCCISKEFIISIYGSGDLYFD